ncbi:hypothetical protein GHT06_002336 [Daphnia sinensis]|uniref:Uncharacterized protein n=1 Tax=Daphnia sinensis TaxID=1820382 RepID=A0AAD5PMX4_9CRUS|nr:hypothetical protein GHT06_002336 [Daphnia sinensis]
MSIQSFDSSGALKLSLILFCMEMDSEIKTCCVHSLFPNSACHQTCYIKEKKLILIEELSECDQRTIKLRVQCHIETICAYHFYIYHTSFEKRQTVCSDPFSKHKKKIKGQYNITLTFSDSVNCLRLPLALIPGKKLCSRCLNEVKHALQSLKENTSPEDDIEKNLDVPEDDWARENMFTPTKVIKALESSSVISPVHNLTKSSKAERLVIFDI